jgi:endonuclease G
MPAKKTRNRASNSSKKSRNSVSRLGLSSSIATFTVLQMTSCGLSFSQSLASWDRPTSSTTASTSHKPTHPTTSTGSGKSIGFSACPQFFAGGQAPAIARTTGLRELCYEAFAVLHSGKTRTPVFVSQRLNRQSLQQARKEKRTDKFFADARLPRGERAELGDYKGSGYSRGHMAPAADMPNANAMAQSFSLANMVPQDIKQNSGPWAAIEKDTRAYAMRARGDVYVITGPVFDAEAATVGSNRVSVPSHLFKLVYDAETGRSWAHWQDNAATARVSRPISYQELVARTRMEWLPLLHND